MAIIPTNSTTHHQSQGQDLGGGIRQDGKECRRQETWGPFGEFIIRPFISLVVELS